jgi:hypothetical protein
MIKTTLNLEIKTMIETFTIDNMWQIYGCGTMPPMCVSSKFSS